MPRIKPGNLAGDYEAIAADWPKLDQTAKNVKTCPVCQGVGEDDHSICGSCNGNGYVPDRDVSDPLPDHAGTNDWEDADQPAELDFTPAPPPAPVNRMANQTWRILEEQRVTALETAADLGNQIEALTAKRNDALRAAAMCEAGQKGAE